MSPYLSLPLRLTLSLSASMLLSRPNTALHPASGHASRHFAGMETHLPCPTLSLLSPRRQSHLCLSPSLPPASSPLLRGLSHSPLPPIRMCDKEPDVDFEPTVYPEAETTTADDIRANEKTVEHRVKNGRDLQLQVLERHVLGRTNLAKRSSLVKRFANLSQGRPPQERPSSVDSLFATQKEAVVEEVVKEEVEEEVEVETVVPAAKEERTEQAATPAEAAPGPTTAAAQATLARLMGIGTSYTDEVPSVEVQGRLGGAKTTYICHDCKTQPLRSLEFIHHCSTKQHLNSVRNEPFVSAIVTALQSEAAFQWSVTRS